MASRDREPGVPVGLQRGQGLGSGAHRRAGRRLRRLRQEGHEGPRRSQQERHAVRLDGAWPCRPGGGEERDLRRRHAPLQRRARLRRPPRRNCANAVAAPSNRLHRAGGARAAWRRSGHSRRSRRGLEDRMSVSEGMPVAAGRAPIGRIARRMAAGLLPKLVLAPSFAVILLFVYGFILFTGVLSLHRLEDPAVLRLGRPRATTRKLWALPQLVTRAQEPGDLRLALHRASARCSASVLAILLDQKIRGEGLPAPDLPLPDGAVLHRHRHRLEMVPRSRHRARAHHAPLGLGELLLHLDQGRQDGDLHASSSPPSGSPPASSWRCSWPACAASTTRSSRRRRSTAPRPSPSIAASSSR